MSMQRHILRQFFVAGFGFFFTADRPDDQRSQAGKTALVEAVEKKHMDLADTLLSHGMFKET